tara:strand:+ start:690 stop:1340 length:651 start_codon:yes stop_codon:yes gene_type:complete
MINYHVVFGKSKSVDVGRCSIESNTDKTITSYWDSSSSLYQDFTSYGINTGEVLYLREGGNVPIFLGRVESISSTVLTLYANPGMFAYEQVLQNGFMLPYVIKGRELYSYPLHKYCGASLVKVGENYKSYSLTTSIESESTTVDTNSVIALYFEKGDAMDEVRVSVKAGKENIAIRKINNIFSQQKNIDFQTEISQADSTIIGIDSIVSSIVQDNY